MMPHHMMQFLLFCDSPKHTTGHNDPAADMAATVILQAGEKTQAQNCPARNPTRSPI